MRESDLIRQALEEELLQKERVRTACLAATIGERRGGDDAALLGHGRGG